MIKKIRSSVWFLTIILLAAMLTAFACSANDLGDPLAPVGDSESAPADSTESALTRETEDAPPQEANEKTSEECSVEDNVKVNPGVVERGHSPEPAPGPLAAEVEGVDA